MGKMRSLAHGFTTRHVQRSEKWFVRGWENFITALAYLFCLAQHGSCLAMFAKPFFTTQMISGLLEPFNLLSNVSSPGTQRPLL